MHATNSKMYTFLYTNNKLVSLPLTRKKVLVGGAILKQSFKTSVYAIMSSQDYPQPQIRL